MAYGVIMNAQNPQAAGASPEAIRAHYDVGNEFYRMVLGPSMAYSCARFVGDDMTL